MGEYGLWCQTTFFENEAEYRYVRVESLPHSDDLIDVIGRQRCR
jgi:hypothetical protein